MVDQVVQQKGEWSVDELCVPIKHTTLVASIHPIMLHSLHMFVQVKSV